MQFADFASQLTQFPDHELTFEFGTATIGRRYHLTEVLRVTIDAIDCGGAVDQWTETVLQLVDTPPDEGRPTMSARRASSILQQSQARLPLAPESEVVLEFRPAGATAAQRYHVSEIVNGVAGSLRVVTNGTRTQCKAAERSRSVCGAGAASAADDAFSGCCAPRQTSEHSRTAVRCCA